MPLDNIFPLDENQLVSKYFVLLAEYSSSTSFTKTASSSSSSSSPADVDERLNNLLQRLVPAHVLADKRFDNSILRCVLAVQSLCLFSSQWKFVPSNYYSQPLVVRQKILGAKDINMLCKSVSISPPLKTVIVTSHLCVHIFLQLTLSHNTITYYIVWEKLASPPTPPALPPGGGGGA